MIICGMTLVLAGIVWISCRKRMPEKNKKMLGIVAVAALLGALSAIVQSSSPVLLEGNLLARNKNGQGGYEQELRMYLEGEEEGTDYLVTVPEQMLTADEEQQYLSASKEEIEREFRGENTSVNCIRGNVVIRDSYQQGKVSAEWYFDDYTVVDTSGTVIAEELPVEGKLVKASAVLSCGTSEASVEFYFRVYPVVLDEKETFLHQLEKEIARQGGKSGEEFIQLPGRIGAYGVSWEEKRDNTPEKVLLFGIVIAAFLPMLARSREQERQKKRNAMLELEYSDMVSKLALLLGAGMTLQGAFRKIAYAYEKKREDGTVSEMPAYEEMILTCREMDSGMGEGRAYERFGERCGLSVYRKIGSILAQNLKKGSHGIVLLLEQEVENAFEERKSSAKRYGEEAGTKLLLPMMIMLGIVMLILIIPAIFAFQI